MFVYSLPLFFSQVGLVSPLECLIMSLALFVVLLISTVEPADINNGQASANYLFASWSGQVKLIWVFWPFFVILNASLYTADVLVKSGLITVSSWDDVHLMLLLPIVWWMTAIWQCSANTQFKVYSADARLVTFAVLFEYSVKLLLRIDYPRLFFGCEELLLDYGSCF